MSTENNKKYPYEVPLADNIVQAPFTTSHDIPAETVLRAAFDNNLTELVVCGIDENGYEYVLHTATDPAVTLYHLQRAAHIMHLREDRRMMELHGTSLDDHPNPEA